MLKLLNGIPCTPFRSIPTTDLELKFPTSFNGLFLPNSEFRNSKSGKMKTLIPTNFFRKIFKGYPDTI
jgi:hypothetical protein